MHKGMLSGLWSLKWVLLCLLLTACKPTPPPPTPPTPTPTPPAPTNPDITVTGKIMLGPVVRGHSLQLVIYDPDMKELYRPKIGLDGGYGFTLKDYEGAVIAQVTSINPQQDCSAGDYIDEATAKPKCLGKNSILSSTVLKLDNTSSDNQAKLHTTSVTTIAALNAGISINEDGTITVDEKLSPEIIDQSNKTIARALGLGDQSVAEYTPKSIITTDQKFQSGDAYSQALAEISGIEAEGKSLNSIVQMISASIGDNGQIAPAVQDMMVKGIQKVFNTAKELGADTSILDQINKRQDTYPDSIVNVDMVNAPEPPVFKHKTKTSNQQPTWEWISGGTGNNRYQYRFGAEVDLQGNRNWKEISSNSFTPSDNLKQGRYVLEIQEGHISDSTKWSIPIQSTIEIVANHAPVSNSLEIDDNQKKNDISSITLIANDAENDTLTFKITKVPINGQLLLVDEIIKINQSLKSTDNLTYKRTLPGVDSFEYVANDGSLDSVTSIVNINYENKAPELSLAVNNISVKEQQLVEIPITIKDDLDKDTKRIKLVNPPVNGEIYINGSKVKKGELIQVGSHRLEYKSSSDYAVNDSFQLLANDGHLDSNTIKISINIIPENDPPRITQTNDQKEEVDINSIPLGEFKFQITNERGYKDSYRYRNLSLATHTTGLNHTWIESQTPKHYPQKSDDDLFYTFDLHYKLKQNIRDNPLKDSLRVVLRAQDTGVDKLDTKYAFVIKPTKIIDEENNFKLQHNLTWVDVCWKISKNISVTEAADNNIKETKRRVIETITNSWQKHAALQFDWREDDWPSHLTPDKPSNCSDNYTSSYPQIQVHLNVENDSNDSDESSNKNIVAININADGQMNETDEDIQTYKIIHKFGNALGFPDENKRFDTYIRETNKSFCDEAISFHLVDPKDSSKSDVIKTNTVKIISYKDWQQQPYDPISIMNECRFSSSTSELSTNDIKKVQQYYGIRIAHNPHLIKEGNFFTGLYLEGDEYFYYYNGLKSKEFSSIKKSEIETLGSDMFFALASTDKKKSILFRYEKGGDYSNYIEPEKSPLTHCEKTITDSQNQNTNDSLKLDLVCETVSKFKENFILGDGSIYYRINNVNDIHVDYCEEPDPKYINCVSMRNFFSTSNTLYVKGISYDNNYLQNPL